MRTEINFSSADRQRVMDCARPAILSYCKAKGTKLSDYDYDVIMADSVIKVYKNWNKFDADKASFSTWVGWVLTLEHPRFQGNLLCFRERRCRSLMRLILT